MRAEVVCVVCLFGCGRLGFDGDASGADGANPDTSSACSVGVGSYWPLDTADLTAGVVRDRSGLGIDGTVMGSPAPTIAPGRIGQALAFATTGSAYVKFSTLPLDTSPGSAVTVSMWFWRTDQSVDDALVYVPSSPKYDLWLTRDPRCPGLCLCINTGSGDCWGVLDAGLVDRWVHVAAIFRNGPTTDSELFVDGQARSPTCVFGSCTTSRTLMPPFELGGDDGYYWHGMFDDVRVHKRALSPAEIASLYAGACSS